LTHTRWLFAASVILGAALSAWLIFGAVIGWSVCCGWLTSIGFVIATSVGAAVNVVGLLAFVTRRRTWGAQTFAAVQAGNILFALVASVTVSLAWLPLDAGPALLILILVFLVMRTRPLPDHGR
jgi:hypothetical protein